MARFACLISLLALLPLIASTWPPTRASGTASSTSTDSLPTALAVTTSYRCRWVSRSCPTVSARSLMTRTLERASSATARSRNFAFLPVASISTNCTAGNEIASGMPGRPPPEPRSMTRSAAAAPIHGNSVRLSRTCFFQASAGRVIAVRLNFLLVSSNRARYSPNRSVSPGSNVIEHDAASSRNSCGGSSGLSRGVMADRVRRTRTPHAQGSAGDAWRCSAAVPP